MEDPFPTLQIKRCEFVSRPYPEVIRKSVSNL